MGKALWRIKSGLTTDFIRADCQSEAEKQFLRNHLVTTVDEVSEVDVNQEVCAVYFSDYPTEPAFFCGNATNAKRKARLHIRQWNLSATVVKIEKR